MAKGNENSPQNKEEPAKQDVELLSHKIFTIMQQPKPAKDFITPQKNSDASPPRKPKLK